MSWLGLNTSITGMNTSQRNLYTVNHNVNNADREGYSRQVVKSSANIPLHIPGKGYIGTGIGVDSVERVRDNYLDKKFRTETASFSAWNMKNRALSEIEGVLRGSSEEGINVNIDQLFKSIEDLSNNASDPSYRTAFREKAVTFTAAMNETVNRLYKQQKDLNFEVKTKVKQINDYAEQISSVNEQIFAMEVDGSNANDLRDQRDLLVDKLSKLVDIEAEERTLNNEDIRNKGSLPIRKFEVRVGGKLLVDHNTNNLLKYPPNRMENKVNPEEALYKVEWESGEPLKLKGGEIKGLLEVRDGGYTKEEDEDIEVDPDSVLVKPNYEYKESNGIPFYIKRLDEFAKVFAEKLNIIHKAGTNLNGGTDIPLFEVKGDTGIFRADNIKVSQKIMDDLNNIATIKGDKQNVEDNTILKEMIAAREDTSFFGEDETYQGKPEDYLTSILSTLGTDNQQSKRMKTIEGNIVKNVTNQRLSVSGVNLDEEMANMVKFQKVFTASAKMITTFDQIYDIMINRLGMVGR